MSREEKIAALLRPVVESMGYMWWGVAYHPNTVNAVLRVYVDKPEGDITMDDIVAVTEQLNPVLDVENPIASAYTFEVSSPGMDRPLFTLEQFARYLGETIECRTRERVAGRRTFQGILVAADRDEEKITLELPAGQIPAQVVLTLARINKAQLITRL